MSEFSLTLLTQTRTGLALAVEVLNRVFERHSVTLEERVQVVPRRNVEDPTYLHAIISGSLGRRAYDGLLHQ